MNKYLGYILLIWLTIGLLSSCKNNEKEVTTLSDSVRISAFSLTADSTIIDNLNTVFFTIDLENGLIYNADSLPVGTPIDKLAVTISTDNASAVNITTVDSTFNYLKHEKTKIDFTQPVHVEVVSKSKNYSKVYQIKVNVHTVIPDRLFWGSTQYSKLPGIGELTAQRTVRYQDLIYCFMKRDGAYMLATTPHPSNEWTITTLQLPFTPDIASIQSDANNLYALDTEGTLYTSTDGTTWTSTDTNHAALLGSINGSLLTLTREGDNYYHDFYPRPQGYTPRAIAQDFPVSGHSDMLIYTSSWLTSPQGMIVGGRTASGELTGAMWGYDGSNWAILNDKLPKRENAIFFPYVTFTVDENWVTTEKLTWFIIGGNNDTQALRDLWISHNYGIDWKMGGLDIFLPGYIVSRSGASVIICDEPVNSVLDAWTSIDTPAIPAGYSVCRSFSQSSTQTVPYIYMFGGESYDGFQFDQIWRAVINRLRFEPIP